MAKPATLGELRASGYRRRTVREEIRENLIAKLRSGEKLFPGIVGYDDSVLPQVVNALLAEQTFILLGLRGQAKSRLLRGLATLLDEEVPMLAGSEIADDPFDPISRFGRETVRDLGDKAPVQWLPREYRYVEKLATPDVTIADLIGDIDPIKAAKGGHLLSDEHTIHYGLLPRANRGIFAINELPDLAGKIQVGLFNILQEGDIQIKGYPVRLPLDVLLVFTANPEDYTARGKIITPLKDRIGAEIRTHYPLKLEEGIAITAAESFVKRPWPGGASPELVLSPILNEVIEQLVFLARADRRIDKRSGVSQRLSISLLESIISNAERRALMLGETKIAPRLNDLYAALSAIVGKIELEYEGEQLGTERIAMDLIRKASAAVCERRIKSLDSKRILEKFNSGKTLTIKEMTPTVEVMKEFRGISGLIEAASEAQLEDTRDEQLLVAAELVLEALHAQKRLARSESRDTATYLKSREEKPSRSSDFNERFN